MNVGWGGGLSEHVVLPRKSVFSIPDAVSMEVGGKCHLRIPSRGY